MPSNAPIALIYTRSNLRRGALINFDFRFSWRVLTAIYLFLLYHVHCKCVHIDVITLQEERRDVTHMIGCQRTYQSACKTNRELVDR